MSSLKIGIVGLPNVGKSTLFNALTGRAVPAENYPFCTIDPSVGIVAVPDVRVGKLSEFSKSKKTIPAAIEFIDIAGLVKGASEGEGLGNKFLANIREADAIAEVVRVFEDKNIIHVHNKVDPEGDIGVINLELVLADLEMVTKRKAGLERDMKRGAKEAVAEYVLLEKLKKIFFEGKMANSLTFVDDEKKIAKQLNLLTIKPILYVLNVKGGSTGSPQGGGSPPVGGEKLEEAKKYIESLGSRYVVFDVRTESELGAMSIEDQKVFRAELSSTTLGTGGVSTESGLDALIREGYAMLGLITFFTTGEDETRAWTIKKGSTAPEAGTAIHTDFKDKFIRAEVISYDDLISAGSYAAAREKGLVRTEGKDYIVKDGDVIEFKI